MGPEQKKLISDAVTDLIVIATDIESRFEAHINRLDSLIIELKKAVESNESRIESLKKP